MKHNKYLLLNTYLQTISIYLLKKIHKKKHNLDRGRCYEKTENT